MNFFVIALIAVQALVGQSESKKDAIPPATKQESELPALADLRARAKAGEAEAQFYLGHCYIKGQGVPQNFAEAVKWWRMAADQGEANSQFNLGLCYHNGQGVPQNFAEAVKWWLKAAERGYALAQCSLGNAFMSGQGVPQDHLEGLKWLQKAADQGEGTAQFNLGVCYAQGNGIPRDYAEGYVWLSLSAANGYSGALEARDLVAKQLTPSTLNKAQVRARTLYDEIQGRLAKH